MPKTNAEYQREYRERRTRRLAALDAEIAALRRDLEAALAEVEQLASMQCRHPAAAVDGGRCHACGADVW